MKFDFSNREFYFFMLIFALVAGIAIGSAVNPEPKPNAKNVLSDSEVAARSDLLKEFLDEQSYLQSRIVSLREDIGDAQARVNERIQGANLELLDALKKKIGLTEVKGKGLEIILDDSAAATKTGVVDSDAVVQASDIRDLVNVLAAAEAEGISINDQRFVAGSAITSVGTAILVNNVYTTPPFILKAVGDQELMLQRLLNKNLLSDLYKKRANGLIFEIKGNNLIQIPIFNSDFKVNLINLVE